MRTSAERSDEVKRSVCASSDISRILCCYGVVVASVVLFLCYLGSVID